MSEIENHKWSDTSVCGVVDERESLSVRIYEDVNCVEISKDDAIAIAKHFGLIQTDEQVAELDERRKASKEYLEGLEDK